MDGKLYLEISFVIGTLTGPEQSQARGNDREEVWGRKEGLIWLLTLIVVAILSFHWQIERTNSAMLNFELLCYIISSTVTVLAYCYLQVYTS